MSFSLTDKTRSLSAKRKKEAVLLTQFRPYKILKKSQLKITCQSQNNVEVEKQNS